MDERKTGSFHLTGAGQSGGVSGSESRLHGAQAPSTTIPANTPHSKNPEN